MFHKVFADIKSGEVFEFINDHDPLPLYFKWKQKVKNLLNGIILKNESHQTKRTIFIYKKWFTFLFSFLDWISVNYSRDS
jgi:hypothetical protein